MQSLVFLAFFKLSKINVWEGRLEKERLINIQLVLSHVIFPCVLLAYSNGI